MEYQGYIYAKIGGKYIVIGHSNDYDNKKYTEDDMKKAFKFYAYVHISQQPHSYEKLEQDYLKFINSLNK